MTPNSTSCATCLRRSSAIACSYWRYEFVPMLHASRAVSSRLIVALWSRFRVLINFSASVFIEQILFVGPRGIRLRQPIFWFGLLLEGESQRHGKFAPCALCALAATWL